MIMTKKLLLLLLTVASVPTLSARDLRTEIAKDPSKAAGYYTPYSFDGTKLTPSPKGYEPVYISHYGRHGSRWMTYEEDYTNVLDIFDKAASEDALTPRGKEIHTRVKAIAEDGKFRAGSLSPLGFRQHKGIAERMYRNFPNLFTDSARIDARSTIIIRCVNSMGAFCESLKENNPKLQITRTATLRTTSPLEFFYAKCNEISPDLRAFWEKGLYNFETDSLMDLKIDMDSKLSGLFTKPVITDPKAKRTLFLNLFYLSQDAPNVGMGNITFNDLFTPEELYWMAVFENYRCYAKRGPAPQAANLNLHYAKSLLNDFITRADEVLASGERNADLRFGHDINIMAFVPLLGIGGYDMIETDVEKIGNEWDLARLTPMAANIQFVFYRNPDKKNSDTLVKVLHNEKEVKLPLKGKGPYYKWDDVKKHYAARMASIVPGKPLLKD